jgi:hypothetical protein
MEGLLVSLSSYKSVIIWYVWRLLGYAKEYLGLLACWQGSFGRHRNIDTWRAVPQVVYLAGM